MYQPKIRDDLIPRLYHLAQARGIPMTRLVSQLVEAALEKLEQGVEQVHDPPSEEYQSTSQPRMKGGEQ